MALYLIPEDKGNHAIYGAGAALVVCYLSILSGHPVLDVALHSAVAAAGAGAVKEIRDWMSNDSNGLERMHDVSWGDFFATLLGSVPVISPLLLLHLRGLQ